MSTREKPNLILECCLPEGVVLEIRNDVTHGVESPGAHVIALVTCHDRVVANVRPDTGEQRKHVITMISMAMSSSLLV